MNMRSKFRVFLCSALVLSLQPHCALATTWTRDQLLEFLMPPSLQVSSFKLKWIGTKSPAKEEVELLKTVHDQFEAVYNAAAKVDVKQIWPLPDNFQSLLAVLLEFTKNCKTLITSVEKEMLSQREIESFNKSFNDLRQIFWLQRKETLTPIYQKYWENLGIIVPYDVFKWLGKREPTIEEIALLESARDQSLAAYLAIQKLEEQNSKEIWEKLLSGVSKDEELKKLDTASQKLYHLHIGFQFFSNACANLLYSLEPWFDPSAKLKDRFIENFNKYYFNLEKTLVKQAPQLLREISQKQLYYQFREFLSAENLFTFANGLVEKQPGNILAIADGILKALKGYEDDRDGSQRDQYLSDWIENCSTLPLTIRLRIVKLMLQDKGLRATKMDEFSKYLQLIIPHLVTLYDDPPKVHAFYETDLEVLMEQIKAANPIFYAELDKAIKLNQITQSIPPEAVRFVGKSMHPIN